MSNVDTTPFKNPLGFPINPEIVPYLRSIPSNLIDEFLTSMEVHESFKIRGCQKKKERHAVQVRTLMVGELRNFFKSLQTR